MPDERGFPPVAPMLVAVVAVALAGAVGVTARWPGLVHLVALPPLDLVADIRLLLVETRSLAAFILGSIVSVGLRTVVLAALLCRLDRDGLLAAARCYLLVWPIAFVAASLQYAGVAMLYLQVFWIGTIISVMLALATAAVPWHGTPRARAPRVRDGLVGSARSGFRLGTVGTYLVTLALVGAAADVAGPAGAVALVPVSGALTWLTVWSLRHDWMTRWGAAPLIARRIVAGLAAGASLVVVAVVVAGPTAPPREPIDTSRARDGSLMLMSGIDSSSGSGAILEIDPEVFGWPCEQVHYFSYAGPGDGQPQNDAACPIRHGAPYEAEDTLRSVEELVPWLEEQVAEMSPPKVVAGHSQGAWIVWEAAADGRLDDVDAIVLVGAFPSNPVGYPIDGGGAGRRVVEFLAGFPPPDGTTVFEPDSPLGREWLAPPGAADDTFARSLPGGLRVLSVTSVLDHPAMPHGHRIDGAVDGCPIPVVHPDLPYSRELWQTVEAFVDGDDVERACPFWRTRLGAAAASFTPPPQR
jgi:hypothetical protein